MCHDRCALGSHRPGSQCPECDRPQKRVGQSDVVGASVSRRAQRRTQPAEDMTMRPLYCFTTAGRRIDRTAKAAARSWARRHPKIRGEDVKELQAIVSASAWSAYRNKKS